VDFRRALLAAGLSIAVLFIWQTIFPPVDRSVVSAPEEIESIEGQPAPATDSVVSTGVVSGAESDASAAPGVEAGDTTSAAELVPQVEKVANSEETLVLEARDFRATFSNRGGELTSFRLWRHEETGGDLVDLVQARSAGRSYPLGFVQAADGGEHPLAKALFVATRSTDSEGNESLVAVRQAVRRRSSRSHRQAKSSHMSRPRDRGPSFGVLGCATSPRASSRIGLGVALWCGGKMVTSTGRT